MVNAVNSTSADTPVVAVARVHVADAPAPAPAPAPLPKLAPAPAPESTHVTISPEAHATAARDVAANNASRLAAGARDVAADANASANAQAQKTADAQANSRALAPQTREARVNPAPAPLSLNPLPRQHVPAIAYSPADANQDGQVTASEREAYDFHHPPSLAADPGQEALSAYTSIASS